MAYSTIQFFFFFSCLIMSVNGASIACTNQARVRPRGFGSAKHAVIIGIDGFGGSYFKKVSNSPKYATLRSLLEQGSYTYQGRGVYPTSSGPNWAAYLTGMGPMEHGIFNNYWTIYHGYPARETSHSIPPISGRGRPLTIFRQVKAKDRNLKTGIMFTWPWFKNIVNGDIDVDHRFWSGGLVCGQRESAISCYNRKDLNAILRATAFIKTSKPTLTFIHLDALDAAGHWNQWGSSKYYDTLAVKDKQIKLLLDTLNQTTADSGKPMLEDTFVVVVSDHGGWKTSHGYSAPFSALVDIPILIRGPGVLKNKNLKQRYVSSLDVPVTVLNALGLEKTEFMKGRVLEEIYG